MQRLSGAGFKKDIIRTLILPDWWDDSYENESSLLPDVEFRLARFLGCHIETVRNPSAPLVVPSYAKVQLRRARDLDRDRLIPAIHTAIMVASAVIRNLKSNSFRADIPPSNGLAWREQMIRDKLDVGLRNILHDLWNRGIPVVPLDVLPTPSFQGMACILEGRPVVLLGHKHDEPGRVAFFIAHEIGHIVFEHSSPDSPVIDEEEEIADETDIEQTADSFATMVLAGREKIHTVEADNFKQLANIAGDLEAKEGIDSGAVIFAWARETGNYMTAMLAVKSLYRAKGAKRILIEFLKKHIDMDSASESDKALLKCINMDV